MKNAQKARLLLLLILSIILLGCNKKDDGPSDSDPNAGADHTYELKYVGGYNDGQTISGVVPNTNSSIATYIDAPNLQSIAIGLIDNSHERNIVIIIKRSPGDLNVEIKEDSGNDESGAQIAIYAQNSSQIYQGLNGTLTISNFKVHQEIPNGGIASLIVNFTGQFTESPSQETVEITGKITMNPPSL